MTKGDNRELPYPSGWFFLALSRELSPGRVLTRRLAGEDVVLYRTDDGTPYAVHPYCPHLGAHFGAGGTVEGRNLVCPFHHFAFGPDGICVGTPDGRPPRARVEHHTIRERNGMVFGWYAPDGTAPTWEAPETAPPGVAPVGQWSVEVHAPAQELPENACDYRHLPVVHHVTLRELDPPKAEGPYLRYRLRLGPARPAALRRFQVDHSFLMAGPGCLRVEAALPRLGLVTYLWALHTPTAPGHTLLTIASACSGIRSSRPAGTSPLHHAVARGLLLSASRKALQDVTIWNAKRYEPRPRLAPGDEAIGLYRHWVRQFYPPP
ncbi:Rieske 2Fe-2S domain-containing protein [Streptomyces thioluteus]|uniref:cholesterol 7-desaturase n=1 Tax=Streptomyces thioluteus TaxID=66431 RepID=A0ABN3WCZ1_STRTU